MMNTPACLLQRFARLDKAGGIKRIIYCLLAGLMSVLVVGSTASAALINPSFELGTPTSFSGWTMIGPGGNVFREPSPPNPALQGTFAAKMFSQFTGSDNLTYIIQDLPAMPGQPWTASVSVQHTSGDALAGGNDARLKVEFLDAGLGNLFQLESIILTAADPTDVWTKHNVSAIAPATTAFARITLVFHGDAANSSGAAFFDVASLATVPEPASGALTALAVGLLVFQRRKQRRTR